MFEEITYLPIFGLPLIMYGGIATVLLLIATALVGYLTYTGKAKLPFSWHIWLAATTLVSGLGHATFALLAYV